MTEEEYMVRKAKTELRTKKILEEIENCEKNVLECSSTKIDALYKEIDKVKEEIEDMIIELQVDDFLENGPGIKDDTYEDKQKK